MMISMLLTKIVDPKAFKIEELKNCFLRYNSELPSSAAVEKTILY